MRLMRRAWMLLAAMLVAGPLLPLDSAAQAQTRSEGLPAPTQEQLQIFESLSQDQQDAILKQLGGTLGASTSGTSQDAAAERRNQMSEQASLQGRLRSEELEPPPSVLRADDWVVIEIDFHLQPRPLSQQQEALLSAQGGAGGRPSAQALQALQSGGETSGTQGSQSRDAAGSAAALAAAPNGNGNGAGNDGGYVEPALTTPEQMRLVDLMNLIRHGNPYRLSRDGVLNMPGMPGIALLGLTEDQASFRLQTDPAFRRVQIRITRLPLKKTGEEGLKPFGYDLFDRPPSTFAPVTNVPVPADYVIGAGDELDIQLYGTQNRPVRLVVSRDGVINFPELGPISVAGQTFNSAKADIEGRVARQMIGVHASVSMGDTRAIRVFVLGEAKRVGSYTVSGLGTITSALYAAGGVKPVGSLRNIQLKRQGVLVRTLDLYDLLIRGDTSDDAKLLQGDVIFVPPIGSTVSVEGEVRREAIYEIKHEATVADLVSLAGGLTPDADRNHATLSRIDSQQHRVVLSVDTVAAGTSSQALANGDVLHVGRLRPTMDSGVLVQGHVFNPGPVAYRQGIRLTDIFHSVDDLKPNADTHYLLIRRELPPDRRVAVLSADLSAALAAPGSAADLVLLPRDRITVFDVSSGRDIVIQPLMHELELQSSMSSPRETVHVDGSVKVPGEYPLEPQMTVADLVRAGGGLADQAYGTSAELTRYAIADGGARRTQLVPIDLAAVLRGDANANIKLQPFDTLSIKEVPEWYAQESVTLVGEVRFPGRYSIRRGETLLSVLDRAGGLTDHAFPEGSVFTREELKHREQEQMNLLAERMQRDLAVLALQGAAANQAGAPQALSVGQTLLSQLRSEKAVGRLVIDLPRALHLPPGSLSDVILRQGDQLIVPRFEQEVTVIGEVQNSTSHLYSPGLGREGYIALSGGMTNRADRGKIYVVRANGSVIASSGSRWFQFSGATQINPGDTVVVPLDAEHMPALPFWQAVTQIIYNVAIAAAAVHSF